MSRANSLAILVCVFALSLPSCHNSSSSATGSAPGGGGGGGGGTGGGGSANTSTESFLFYRGSFKSVDPRDVQASYDIDSTFDTAEATHGGEFVEHVNEIHDARLTYVTYSKGPLLFGLSAGVERDSNDKAVAPKAELLADFGSSDVFQVRVDYEFRSGDVNIIADTAAGNRMVTVARDGTASAPQNFAGDPLFCLMEPSFDGWLGSSDAFRTLTPFT